MMVPWKKLVQRTTGKTKTINFLLKFCHKKPLSDRERLFVSRYQVELGNF